MIKIRTFTVNPLGVNCYVMSDDDSREAAVIDCGCMTRHEFEQVADYCDEAGLRPTLSLQTHAHFDHVLGADMLHERYGLQPHCHAMERMTWELNPQMVQDFCGIRIPTPKVAPVYDLTHNQHIPFGNAAIRVLHTPGHTPGGVCFYVEAANVVFSGDTLFHCGLGRADMPGGDWEQEVQSVRQVLFALPGDTRVLPGHGPETGIRFEQDNNPYI